MRLGQLARIRAMVGSMGRLTALANVFKKTVCTISIRKYFCKLKVSFRELL
jgi:hypothetical protein